MRSKGSLLINKQITEQLSVITNLVRRVNVELEYSTTLKNVRKIKLEVN